MTTAADAPRPSWAPIWSYLNNRSRRELDYAHQQVQHELAEQEITGSVHDADDGTERLWNLDSIPFVLARREWSTLTAGLAQRAQLLEALLGDCYGQRRLLAQEWFPRQLVYEHPRYLRPLVGHRPQRFLHCYAADLVRCGDGSWRVLADRCQAPLGLGYALQNRLVIGRSLPDLFRQTQVQALAPFFGDLLESLRRCSPVPNPRVVILGSPNLGNTSYEQAFLARYLDVDLVLADDLTVRGTRLWLKTLGGLVPVDVALRFVDDAWSDPLNLRSDSNIGVPGLVDAVRAGNVVLANALGSGLVDSPGLLPYLERCGEFLGCAGIGIPSVGAGWCGETGVLDAAIAQADQRVLLSAWHGLRQGPVFPHRITDAEDARSLENRLRERPAAYAALDRVRPSSAPAWNEHLQGQHAVVLRLYLLATDDGGWQALPGGLVRSGTDPAFVYYGIRHGGTSKDLWVPVAEGDSAPTTPPMPQYHGGTDRTMEEVPSSSLDDLFWFGRTCEGLDHLARLLRTLVAVQRSQLLGERDGGIGVLDALCDGQAVLEADSARRVRDRFHSLVFAEPPAYSIHRHLDELGRLARRSRGFLSGDSWLLVQELRGQVLGTAINKDARLTTFDRLGIRVLAGADALAGTIGDNMVRDHAWTFVELGRRIQRAIFLADLLTLCQRSLPAANDLLLLFEVADSAITWRARFRRPPDLPGFIGLVGDHDHNPRSLAHQCGRCEQLLRTLPGVAVIGDPLTVLVDSARAGLEARMLHVVADRFRDLSDAIDHRFFSHAVPLRSVDRSQEAF